MQNQETPSQLRVYLEDRVRRHQQQEVVYLELSPQEAQEEECLARDQQVLLLLVGLVPSQLELLFLELGQQDRVALHHKAQAAVCLVELGKINQLEDRCLEQVELWARSQLQASEAISLSQLEAHFLEDHQNLPLRAQHLGQTQENREVVQVFFLEGHNQKKKETHHYLQLEHLPLHQLQEVSHHPVVEVCFQAISKRLLLPVKDSQLPAVASKALNLFSQITSPLLKKSEEALSPLPAAIQAWGSK